MANEKRLRALAIGGWIEDNPLTAAAVTLNSAGLAAMPAVGATEHMPIILDPDGKFGAPEVAYVTAHVLGATSATILRGQEQWTGASPARQHDRDVGWVHTPTPAGDHQELLAITSYNPNETGGGASTLYSITSTTMVDVDATNLAVSFVVPPSGKVLVRLVGTAAISVAGNAFYFGLREATTILNPQANVAQSTNVDMKSVDLLITALTPGVTKTYKWAARVSAATGYFRVGGSAVNDAAGAATMEVWAVNA